VRNSAPVLHFIFMAKLDELKAELLAAKASIEPQIEGLHDFARLNLKPETLAIVQAATVDFERRLSLIVATLTALDNLAADKYPDLPPREVAQAVFFDLKDNVSTIEAAFAKFDALEATQVVINAGPPYPRK
jgi:hypothetical protein